MTTQQEAWRAVERAHKAETSDGHRAVTLDIAGVPWHADVWTDGDGLRRVEAHDGFDYPEGDSHDFERHCVIWSRACGYMVGDAVIAGRVVDAARVATG